ncbi:DUF2946 domain-containing protein [Halomonas caseinilytica]|uniref:DUF2946 domain-containing protein n=1 Tax=Halomonas caseinilytica TaxID=438744 RepID=UPI0010BEE545|nr:DUF2946 domain-containing protein [Halomonas caseinilytica]
MLIVWMMIRLARTNSAHRCLAAILSLMAMVMLFLGPLISQIQASGSQHPLVRMAAMPGITVSNIHDMPETAVFNWHDQCGYCSLWQHFPTAHIDVPAVVRSVLKPADVRFESIRTTAPDDRRRFEGQPRAPPSFW